MSEIIGYNDKVILDQYGASVEAAAGSRSSRPTGSEIPDDWVCVGCGESFGEWSHVITEDCLASEEDSRSERIGDLECNHCGSQEWESPQNDKECHDER